MGLDMGEASVIGLGISSRACRGIRVAVVLCSWAVVP